MNFETNAMTETNISIIYEVLDIPVNGDLMTYDSLAGEWYPAEASCLTRSATITPSYHESLARVFYVINLKRFELNTFTKDYYTLNIILNIIKQLFMKK